MTKALIIVIHPNLENSVINKRWIAELTKYPGKYVIHDLYKTYSSENIDVTNEQQLIEAHDKIIFQFPFYWFSSPPLLKKWLDEVLTYGWAYGSKSGFKLSGKKIALGITTGADEEDYSASGTYKYTLEELITPFKSTFVWVKADYKSFFTYYGAEYKVTPERLKRLEKNAQDYISFIETL